MSNELDVVRAVVVSTLGIEDRADQISEDTPLLNAIPELDSMALVDLVVALEERFGIAIEEDDITGETFETLGTLTAVVRARTSDSTASTG